MQPVNLGHIDLKFVSATRWLQNNNSGQNNGQDPVAIQVTLLKQNATGFGYRMKGAHPNFRHHLLDGGVGGGGSSSDSSSYGSGGGGAVGGLSSDGG